jgi:hypothetical protein
MCVDDGVCGREVEGEVRIEADRVDVEERHQRSACVVGEFCEDLGLDGGYRQDVCVGS